MKALQPVFDAFTGPRFKPTIILLVSSPLLLVWRYYGTPEFFADHLASSGSDEIDREVAGAIYHFVSCFLLMALLPILCVKLVFRERLRDYGVGLGSLVRTVRSFLMLAPVFIVIGYIGSSDAGILEKFPINKHAGQSATMFALHAATYSLFYLGWEFYFRGFLLFGLRDSVGAANAVLIQTLASALLHIGSPASETFGAILGGLLWGMLALRTRSLLSGFGQHFLLGITVDWCIAYG